MPQHDLTRNVLAAILVVGLIALSFWVLRPFLAASVWATMIVVATWPWLKALERGFGGRRAPAVLVMTIGMLLLLVMLGIRGADGQASSEAFPEIAHRPPEAVAPVT